MSLPVCHFTELLRKGPMIPREGQDLPPMAGAGVLGLSH